MHKSQTTFETILRSFSWSRAAAFLICAGLFSISLASRAAAQEEKRLTPNEIAAIAHAEAGAGTSGINGIQTRVLKGDPTKAGLYTIQLTVPANTKIQAHDHPDDRIATVISGTWYIGYGAQFDEKNLKALTAGSFYTEPPGISHFARTGDQSVVVQITGYGPTGTVYTDARNKPVGSSNTKIKTPPSRRKAK